MRFFSEFGEDFPGARVVRLSRNYRSSRNIAALSGQIIAPSEDRRERTRSTPVHETTPDLVTIHEAPTEKAEAEFIVESLERMLGGHSFFSIDSGRSAGAGGDSEGGDFSFADFAVLYRSRAQAPALAEALQRSGMPFQHRSHRFLADRPGVSVLAEALRETPGSGSVSARVEALSRQLDHDETELRTARDRLMPLAETCGEDLGRFLSEIAFATEIDTWDPRADRISLLTLHAAKGLEFPVVFVAGCEDGLLPLKWGAPDPEDLEEERRLFYVGVTRARSKLLLTRAKKRLVQGKVRERSPSPYLAGIEEGLLERRHSRPPDGRPRERFRQPDLFS